MNKESFHGKSVVITGASQGIGKALALELASRGARLALAARNKPLLEAVGAECRKQNAATLAIETDIAVEAQCKSLIDHTVREYSDIDILINNAGFGQAGKMEELADLTMFERIMQVNLMGTVNCTYHALPYIKRTKGKIIGISSIGGKAPFAGFASYCASKYAMVGFLQSLRLEVRDDGVGVLLVYPDIVATDFRSNVFDAQGKQVIRTYSQQEKRLLMSAKTCARLIIEGIVSGREELTMQRGFARPVD